MGSQQSQRTFCFSTSRRRTQNIRDSLACCSAWELVFRVRIARMIEENRTEKIVVSILGWRERARVSLERKWVKVSPIQPTLVSSSCMTAQSELLPCTRGLQTEEGCLEGNLSQSSSFGSRWQWQYQTHCGGTRRLLPLPGLGESRNSRSESPTLKCDQNQKYRASFGIWFAQLRLLLQHCEFGIPLAHPL
jgi:hypothetical protein